MCNMHYLFTFLSCSSSPCAKCIIFLFHCLFKLFYTTMEYLFWSTSLCTTLSSYPFLTSHWATMHDLCLSLSLSVVDAVYLCVSSASTGLITLRQLHPLEPYNLIFYNHIFVHIFQPAVQVIRQPCFNSTQNSSTASLHWLKYMALTWCLSWILTLSQFFKPLVASAPGRQRSRPVWWGPTVGSQ